jgi:hypothetical protein
MCKETPRSVLLEYIRVDDGTRVRKDYTNELPKDCVGKNFERAFDLAALDASTRPIDTTRIIVEDIKFF